MVTAAQSLGADAVVAMRFASDSIAEGTIEILAYGTAVKFAWVCKIVCVSPLKGQRLRRRSSPAQGAGHATMAAAWPAADWRRP